MSWRYQPVILRSRDEDYVVMIECFFNDDGTLKAWESRDDDNTNTSREPIGETAEELQRALGCMLLDAMTWIPVRYTDLRVGMTLPKNSDPNEIYQKWLLDMNGPRKTRFAPEDPNA